MRLRSAWLAVCLVVCFGTARAQSDADKAKDAAKDAAGAVKDAAGAVKDAAGAAKDAAGEAGAEAEMMAKWTAHATPGEGHKVLEGMIGKWNATSKFWMDPAAPPQESKGTAESTWVLGNRFVQQTFAGEMMGEKFTGLGFTGYDNTAKVYVNTWMDSMTTSIMYSTGTWDAAKKELTSKGEYADPMTGKNKTYRSVMKVVSDDQHVFEMHEAGPDGKEFKTLELTYTRAK